MTLVQNGSELVWTWQKIGKKQAKNVFFSVFSLFFHFWNHFLTTFLTLFFPNSTKMTLTIHFCSFLSVLKIPVFGPPKNTFFWPNRSNPHMYFVKKRQKSGIFWSKSEFSRILTKIFVFFVKSDFLRWSKNGSFLGSFLDPLFEGFWQLWSFWQYLPRIVVHYIWYESLLVGPSKKWSKRWSIFGPPKKVAPPG